jgi:2-keto-3-deoxy-L-rhamnonate aldolase RhmA
MTSPPANRFRRALLERIPTFGAWLQIGHAACAEIFGRLGFDWICVDLEHGAIDLESTAAIFRAVEAAGSVPVARLPMDDPIWIRRTLDAGARGLIIPMVNSAEQARAVVRYGKYPPLGERGFGYSRANLHGIDFEPYIQDANREIALVMQVEHRHGIDAIDQILEVEGVDGAFIGPLDLSGSYGKTGQLDCPEMVDALSRFRRSCAAHGKPAGMHVVRPGNGNVEQAIRDGYTMIALGLDTVFLAAGAQAALAEAHSAVVGDARR